MLATEPAMPAVRFDSHGYTRTCMDRNAEPVTVKSAPVTMIRSRYGQGKTATTILADQGDFVTVIADDFHKTRTRNQGDIFTPRPARGSRAMHRSTLQIHAQAPQRTDYTTTVQANFGGRRDVAPVFKSSPYPSQHTSQISLQSRPPDPQPPTHYRELFYSKETQPYFRLHYPTFENKMNMNEGSGMKQVMAPSGGPGGSSSWTQYGRVHNKLGVMLGPGVPRPYPVRTQYNVITGEQGGPAWKDDNKKISGNRVLYHGSRYDANKRFIF